MIHQTRPATGSLRKGFTSAPPVEPVDDVHDVLVTVYLGIIMGIGGVLALLVRPSLFDELHDQITAAMT